MKLSIGEDPVPLNADRLTALVRRGRATDGEVRTLALDLASGSPVFSALASGSPVTDTELESALVDVRTSAPSVAQIFEKFLASRRADPWLNPLGAGTPPF